MEFDENFWKRLELTMERAILKAKSDSGHHEAGIEGAIKKIDKQLEEIDKLSG